MSRQVHLTITIEDMYHLPSVLLPSLVALLVGLGFCFGQTSTQNQGGGISWQQEHLIKQVDLFKKVTPIRFEGRNQTDREIKILGVIADCSACASPKASMDIVPPGSEFTVHAMVRLVSTEGVQRGKLLVNTEVLGGESESTVSQPHVYNLSYEVKFPPPMHVSPSVLEWAPDSVEPKVLTLTFDKSKGFEYLSFEVDSNSFSVEERFESENRVVLVVTPLVSLVTPSSIALTYTSDLSGRTKSTTRIPLQLSP